jgi:hypothetical protein
MVVGYIISERPRVPASPRPRVSPSPVSPRPRVSASPCPRVPVSPRPRVLTQRPKTLCKCPLSTGEHRGIAKRVGTRFRLA